MLKIIKGIYLVSAQLFDPAMEGNPYEKEKGFGKRKSRHQAKNKGWSFRHWARI